jgi:hypothetical protein
LIVEIVGIVPGFSRGDIHFGDDIYFAIVRVIPGAIGGDSVVSADGEAS